MTIPPITKLEIGQISKVMIIVMTSPGQEVCGSRHSSSKIGTIGWAVP